MSPKYRAQKIPSSHWATPEVLYECLHLEFHFTLDPCPLRQEGGLFGSRDGLLMPWTNQRVFCNPPYDRSVRQWLVKSQEADLAVFLLPVRTDTAWWHEIVLPHATEIRFLKGRLHFNDRNGRAPFPSVVVIFGAVHCAESPYA